MSTNRKERIGTVISAKASKTLVVRVERRAPEPLFGKMMRSSKTYHVHDARGLAHTGDTVKIAECRPLSKTKRWRLLAVLATASPLAVPAAPAGV